MRVQGKRQINGGLVFVFCRGYKNLAKWSREEAEPVGRIDGGWAGLPTQHKGGDTATVMRTSANVLLYAVTVSNRASTTQVQLPLHIA